MTDIITDALVDSLKDTVKLLPFLYLTFLFMEFLEHHMGAKTKAVIARTDKSGPAIGAALGILPQCGFSTVASNLYSGGVITLGTLMAVFLSTSDEMLPLFISEGAQVSVMLKILAVKFIYGMTAGFVLDLVIRAMRSRGRASKRTDPDIEELCEHDHCSCGKGGIWRSAWHHTWTISLFILIISLAISLAIGLLGEDAVKGVIKGHTVLGPLFSSLVGLIPNCAASVIITQLYLDGMITAGTAMAGLFTGAGVGLLVLFRMNRHVKQNLIIVVILYFTGTAGGLLVELLNRFTGFLP